VVQIQDTIDPLIDVAHAQSAAAYRLATLAHKLSDVSSETDIKNITALIDEAIASFDSNEQVLRVGDPAEGIQPIANSQALEALTRADNQWTRYRELLVQYKTDPQHTSLLAQIDTQSTAVFVYTSEFADSVELIVSSTFRDAEQTFALVALITLVVLVLSYLLLSQIARALRRLTVAAQAYARGQYDVSTGRQQLNEFAQVGGVLKNMAASVASR